MNEKVELAGYLCNLITIMEAKEDAAIARGKTLGKEYEIGYARLMEIIKREHEHEARYRKDYPQDGNQGRGQQSLSLGRESDGIAGSQAGSALVQRQSILNSPESVDVESQIR